LAPARALTGSTPAVHVVVMTDDSYAPWCAVTIASCATATDGEVVFHVLHPAELSSDARDRLRAVAVDRRASIVLHSFDEPALAALPSKGPDWGGKMSWARVLLPELLPDLDRVLYLDADTLVVDSVRPLWDMPMLGAPVAAVANVTEPRMRPHVRSLGLDPIGGYFNAGVLVVNLDQWRAEGAGEAVTAVAQSRETLPWYDQDALNSVFAGRWRPLHPRWNAQNSLWTWSDWANEIFGDDRVSEARTAPAVLHFEGPHISKPWHYLSTHPYTARYRDVLATTPWAATPLHDRTAATVVIRRLPRRHRLGAFIALLKWRGTLRRGRVRAAVRLRRALRH
jgi:lipopolysaccharide biosynthesis glycosyltransferase